jgi:hypothetical protein
MTVTRTNLTAAILSLVFHMTIWTRTSSAFFMPQQQPVRKSRMGGREQVVVGWMASTTTVEAPTRERTDRKTGGNNSRESYDDDNDQIINHQGGDYSDLEYYMDPYALRGDADPFHILLMGSTFDKPKITIPYVSSTLEYVLGMPTVEGIELSKFAKDEGMSCLGTWNHEECIKFGKQLQVRDIVCRVVPFCEGGQRGWQAKDGAASNNNDNAARRSGASF